MWSECLNVCDAALVQSAGGEGCTSQVCHRSGLRGLLESSLHEHSGPFGLYQGANSVCLILTCFCSYANHVIHYELVDDWFLYSLVYI